MKTKSLKLWSIVLLSLTMAGCNACDNCPTARPSGLVNRFAFANIDRVGEIPVTASCLSGEQLLGGGYWFEGSGTDIRVGRGISVTASFPADNKTSWTVNFLNPPSIPSDRNIGKIVRVDCYCLPVDVVDLGMEINSAKEPTPLNNVVNTLKVAAPTGSVVTGGGFKMDYAGGEDPVPISYFNGYVLASAPLISEGATIGWQVGKMATVSNQPAGMTAYVLYATKNLSAGKPLRVLAGTDNNGWGSHAATPQCEDDEFVTGGGYEIINEGITSPQLIPHMVGEDLAFNDSSGWRFHSIDGYNNKAGEQTTAAVFVSAVCLKSPRPTLCVIIKTPSDGSNVEPEANDPARATKPIIFSAEAFKGRRRLPDSALTWSVDGVQFATGNNVSFALPFPSPIPSDVGFDQKFQVTVTARDGSDVASATITLFAGRVIIL